jgi:hypothetical protein
LFKIIKNIFFDFSVKSDIGKDEFMRYIVFTIYNPVLEYNSQKTNVTLVTLLNNVLGNIITENQIDALVALRNIFV